MYHMARNIGMQLNLVVDEINLVLPNVIPSTFNILLLGAYSYQAHFLNCMFLLELVPSQVTKIN